MNTHKMICDSCGVEWVADTSAPDSPDIIVTRMQTCESCCPQSEPVEENEKS